MTRDFSGFLDLLRSHGVVSGNTELSLRLDELSKTFSSHAPTAPVQAQVPQPPPQQQQQQQQPVTATAVSMFGGREPDVHSVASSTVGADKHAPQRPRHRRRPTMGTISSASSDNFGIMSQRHSGLGLVHNFPPSTATFYPDAFAYEVITQPTPENASFPSYTPDPQAPSGWVEQPVITQTAPPQAMVAEMATPAAPHQYTMYEQSFSRRLQYAMLHRMLMLANMGNPSPEKFNAVFSMGLFFEPRDTIVYRLGQQMECLTRGGRPSTDVLPHDKRFDERFDKTYLDGVYLDPDEVETYLGQRGVRIPGNAEILEVELSPHDFGSADQPGGSGGGGGGIPASGSVTMTDGSMFGDGSMGGSGGDASTGNMNAFLYPTANVQVGSSSSWASSQSPQRFKTTLNVGVLIEQMVNRAVFLGRTPGIRTRDVDVSVKMVTGLYQH